MYQEKNIFWSKSHGRKEWRTTAGFTNADSDRSERHADSSSQFQSEWTMRCKLFMVCLAPAQPTKARLQETSNDSIKQRKEYKVWPNKSHIHLHNIICSCFTCLLSIVVSRPVFVASHRGVIQECLVCTARHPAFILISQVFDSSTDSPNSRLKTVSHAACHTSMRVSTIFMYTCTKKRTYFEANPMEERNDVPLQDSQMQTQIGAKDMQIHLHNSNQSELCDVNSSWSA